MSSFEHIIQTSPIVPRNPEIPGPFYIMKFGKHKGKKALDIRNDEGYLKWIENVSGDKSNFTDLLKSLDIIRSLEFNHYKSITPKPEVTNLTINFGKHKGKSLHDICREDIEYAKFLSKIIPKSSEYFDFYYRIETVVESFLLESINLPTVNDDVTTSEDQKNSAKIEIMGISDLVTPDLNTSKDHDGAVNLSEKISILISPTNSPKNSTLQTTLEMYNRGLTLDEISKIRELRLQTIESHVIDLIKLGKIVDDNVNSELSNLIREYYLNNGLPQRRDVKNYFSSIGVDITYFQINLALSRL